MMERRGYEGGDNYLGKSPNSTVYPILEGLDAVNRSVPYHLNYKQQS